MSQQHDSTGPGHSGQDRHQDSAGHQHDRGRRGPVDGLDTDQDPVAFWEDFYGGDRRPWSGRPNRILVEELTERPLAAGAVLDLGSGSGADAIWFAELGWTVTGADISSAALAVAAAAAETAAVSERITWLHTDLELDFPAGSWDLVVASYLHSPVAFARDRVLRRAADAVAPGGTLLVLGHEGFPAWHDSPVTMPTVAEVLGAVGLGTAGLGAAGLDGWDIVRTAIVPFEMTSPEGEPGIRTDHVIRLRRS